MKLDGGTAFPVLHIIDGNWVDEPKEKYRGMTMRDYFAAAAITGMLAHHRYDDRFVVSAVIESYAIADAMLKERAK